jgi:pimeloyl-ACP methyl ester carboxylesterase
LLDSLGIDRAVICGLSMGGYVTLALARRHPSRVRALVLCDTRAEADAKAGQLARMELIRRLRSEGIEPLVEDIPRLVSRISRLSQPELISRLESMIRSATVEGSAAALYAMARRPDASAGLRDVHVPTLVVVGSEDEVTPPGQSQMLARGIRGARLEVIDTAGHLSALEQPALFNTVLKAFLSALPAGIS